MSEKKRKPTHPGIILEELYILQELADNLDISRNILCRIRTAKARVTPSIAIRLAEAFNTSPDLWLNLQQKYDLWIEENEKSHKPVKLMYRAPPVRSRIRRMPKVLLEGLTRRHNSEWK